MLACGPYTLQVRCPADLSYGSIPRRRGHRRRLSYGMCRFLHFQTQLRRSDRPHDWVESVPVVEQNSTYFGEACNADLDLLGDERHGFCSSGTSGCSPKRSAVLRIGGYLILPSRLARLGCSKSGLFRIKSA